MKFKKAFSDVSRGRGCARSIMITCCVGAAFLGPPGLGGDNRGLSSVFDNQSFLTGGGTGVVTVAIDTSPVQIYKTKKMRKLEIDFVCFCFFFVVDRPFHSPIIRSASLHA